MEPNHIPFENLPITNRFMFALVFGHKRIAKPFLKAILGIKIFDLQEPQPEKSAESSLFNKGGSYRNLKEQYIIFISPDDIFKQDCAVYKFKNMEIGQPEHELGTYASKITMSPRSRSRSILNISRPARIHPREQRISNASGNGIFRTTKRGSAI